MTSTTLAEIKLPEQYGELMTLITRRPAPEEGEAKEDVLRELYAAILTSPNYNAWRQGMSPEAFQNPTAYGGTAPRDPFEGYTTLPQVNVWDSWIPTAGAPNDRMAFDGKVYSFTDAKPWRSRSGYAGLLGAIEFELHKLTGRWPLGTGSWQSEKFGAGLPSNGPMAQSMIPEYHSEAADWNAGFMKPGELTGGSMGNGPSSRFPLPSRVSGQPNRPSSGQTYPNPIYVQRQQLRKGLVDPVAWKAALKKAGLETATPTTKAEAETMFKKVVPYYWEQRLRLSAQGEFNGYNMRLIRARELGLRDRARVPIGPDGLSIQIHHVVERNQDPSKALDPGNLIEMFGRQHDFQHPAPPANRFRLLFPGNIPRTPHTRPADEFGDPLLFQRWP